MPLSQVDRKLERNAGRRRRARRSHEAVYLPHAESLTAVDRYIRWRRWHRRRLVWGGSLFVAAVLAWRHFGKDDGRRANTGHRCAGRSTGKRANPSL